METSTAAAALAALGKVARLRMLKLVMTNGASGLPAGDIGGMLELPSSTASSHLRALEGVGLLRATRMGRSVYYAVHIDAVKRLFAFVTETCCGGEPERCGTLNPLAPPARVLGPARAEEAPRRSCCGPRKTEAPPPAPVHNVLFLCVRNSARSIMAEAIMNKVGAGRFRAFSGGPVPSPTGPRPEVLATLRAYGHDVSGLRSKDCDEFYLPGAPEIHFVIQLCETPVAGVCGELGDHPVTAAWPLPDPAKFRGRSVERQVLLNELYGALQRRIGAFMGLPVASLDRVTLTRRLNDIGSPVPVPLAVE